MKQRNIFLVGVVLLAVVYDSLKTHLEGMIFGGIVVGYVILVRFIADRYGK